MDERIGLLGAGQMATALARGFVAAGLVDGERLLASDPSPEARARFAQATGGRTTADNRQVVAESDIIFLAVKPQHLGDVLAGLPQRATAEKLVISIVAGVKLAAMAERLAPETRLVRVMPNTPSLVARGASGYCLGGAARAEDAATVERLLQAVGTAWQVEERLMDAVTGLSGSGPAFIYVAIEALSDGGVRAGLPRAIASALAAQTVLGAAEMVLQTGEHPAVLKDRVTSPGGTTIAGLQALEAGGLRAALMGAVDAAARRSAELGAAWTGRPSGHEKT